MSKAKEWTEGMMAWLADATADIDPDYGKLQLSIKAGIVRISFDDGSWCDFTEPMSFSEDGKDA